MVSVSVVDDTQAVSPNWQWRNWEGLPYLTCNLLHHWQHGFFTQQFYPRLPEELINTFSSNASVYRLRQIHSDRVLTPTEIKLAQLNTDPVNNLAAGDGIITDELQQSVWVASADCNPILIGDLATGKVCSIHAGWRGTAQRIIPKAIARFQTLGSSLAHLRIAIGPAIAGEVYQVETPVAAQVGASIIDSVDAADSSAIITALQQLPDSPLLDDETPGRFRLDIRRVNQIQIEQLGISPQQIAIAPFCTYQHCDRFFSYRRTQQKKVQWSGIISSQIN